MVTARVEMFTVIHCGARIDEDATRELVDLAGSWSHAAGPGVTRLIEVWASPWSWLLPSCLAMSGSAGGTMWPAPLPVADDLVAGIRATGVTVRHRRARQSLVDQAELWAMSQGWPVRYV